ncbi:structural maintenance of chromosomes protein 6 [Salmo salar]|uniref:Structural maintenance of chromosomes protein 6 n=1 Tax=Salmo salar TaxID=8030 RepID=A0ABM3CVL2_SALSA|nr:structural maintenance of chromosomes protein 6-like [Salmo salar]
MCFCILLCFRGVNHPDYPSVLDSLSIANPVITNCLFDMRGRESILIIKEKDAARKVMQQGRPPRNCREAFTVEGDQVYRNRYYTPDFGMAKYLRGDLETEIHILESELKNYKAQLSRFHLHLGSVTEDIQRIEAKLHNTIMTLKKTLATVNQVKASVMMSRVGGGTSRTSASWSGPATTGLRRDTWNEGLIR